MNFKELIVDTEQERKKRIYQLEKLGFGALPTGIKNEIAKDIIRIGKLPETISQGVVNKINIKGNIEKEGYEIGTMLLEENAGILEHAHTKDSEKYMGVTTFISNGEIVKEQTCYIGNKHNIENEARKRLIVNIKIAESIKQQDVEELLNKITADNILSKETQTSLQKIQSDFTMKNNINSHGSK